MRGLKKALIASILVVYNFSFLGNYFQYGMVPTVEAAGSSKKVDLVAILVDESIYGAIQGDLNWYVSSYIPKHATDTKTLVFPINSGGFQPKDIYQILENLYYDGEQ
ncbi:MAG: hypothetical protein H6765_04170 [Candidatus Peribacteria bacterium]|nr:MAG: hypothetical protein H6765_04170 [Candidatus Peribacteria bacterium]